MLQSRQERAAHAKQALVNRGSVFSASDSPASLAAAKKVIHRIVAERHDRPSLVAKIASDIGAEIIQGLFRPGTISIA